MLAIGWSGGAGGMGLVLRTEAAGKVGRWGPRVPGEVLELECSLEDGCNCAR